MIKKFIIYPLLVLLGLAVLAAGLLVLTPVPYIPVNHMLSHSAEFSGHVTGNLDSGAVLENFVVRGKPAGELSIKRMVFEYSGLWDFLVNDVLIIEEITIEGLKLNLPKGNFDNWEQLEKRLQEACYLLIPIKNDQVKFIRMKNVVIKDVEVNIGKKETIPGFPMGLPNSPAVMGWVMPKGEQKPKTMLPPIVVDHFEMVNHRYTTFQSTRPVVLTRANIEGLAIDKYTFEVARLEFEGDTFQVMVGVLDPAQNTTEATHFIKGFVKKESSPNLKKDITIDGIFAWMRYLKINIYDGKLSFSVSEKAPGNPWPNMNMKIENLNIRDYYVDTAPLTDLSFQFSFADLLSRQRPILYFNLGATKFGTTDISKKFSAAMMKTVDFPESEPIPILDAASTTEGNVTATILLDRVTHGRMLIDLRIMPPDLERHELLGKVIYNKPYRELTAEEIDNLRALAPWFLVPVEEIVEPLRKKTVPTQRIKKRARRR